MPYFHRRIKIMAKSPPAKEQSNTLKLLIRFLPAIMGFGMYLLATNHGFVLDDNLVLTSNSHVQEGFGGIPDLLKYNYAHGHSGFNDGLYRPLSLVTFAIEKSLFNLSPGVSHFIQALLYAILLILLILWLELLFKEHRKWVFWICLLFALHPIHTEVVANLKGRDDLLAMLFFCSAAWQYTKWIDDKRLLSLGVGALLFLGALFSKESAVTFLVVFPLISWYRSQTLATASIGFGAVLAPTALFLSIRALILSSLDEVDSGVSNLLQNSLLESTSWAERLVTAANIQGLYLQKLFIPWNLSHDYSFNAIPVVGFDSIKGILLSITLIALIAGGIYYASKKNWVGFGILFYFITISAASNFFILIGAMAAERFVFAPSLGWSIAVVAIVLGSKQIHSTFTKEKYRIMVLSALVGIFSVLTADRIPDWKSNYTLFTADVDKVPESARAQYNAGSAMIDEAKINRRQASSLTKEAQRHLRRAIEIWPDYQDAYNNLGISYMNSQEFKSAYEIYTSFIKKFPDYSKARYNMAVTCQKLERFDEAEMHFEAFLESNPSQRDALYYSAECEGFQAKFSEAIAHLETLIKLEPKKLRGVLKLGMAYAMSNDLENAEFYLLKATQMDPNNADALFNLAVFYATTEQEEKALRQLRICLKINPNYERAQGLLNQIQGVITP
jgi:protein O-mannosyl-transferase